MMTMKCSRCKKQFDKTFTVEKKVVCVNCLTDDEMDDLVKKLDEFWKKKP